MMNNSDSICQLNAKQGVNVERLGYLYVEDYDYDIFCNVLPEVIVQKTEQYEPGADDILVVQKDENNAYYAEGFSFPPDAIAYLFCKLSCDETLDLCAYLFARFRGKVWLDGKVLTVGSDWIDSVCKIRLTKGIHTLILETPDWQNYLNINLRFAPLSAEECGNYYSLLDRNFALSQSVIMLDNAHSIYKAKPFCIMVTPTDQIAYPAGHPISLRLYNVHTGQQWSLQAHTAEQIDIQAEQPITNEDQLDGLTIEIFLQNGSDSAPDYTHQFIRPNPGEPLVSYYKESPDLLLRETYPSGLDGQEERYNICLPEGYDKTIKYPLFLVLSTERYSTECTVISKYTKEPIIAADVTGRGVTMGSYIGEASILEALAVLKQRYSIDEDRIYLVGYSNGAAAAWAIAEAYPHLFAGVLLFSGYTNLEKLCNLNNLRIINVSSPYEDMFHRAWELPSERLRGRQNYMGVLAEGLEHFQLLKLRGKERIYEDLLQWRREKYPRKIDYYTNFHRHRKAYWITLHAIQFERRFMTLHACADKTKIKIQTENAAGLTVALPPYIDRTHFTVTINGVEFSFQNFAGEEMHFQCDKGKVRMLEQPPVIDGRKGAGLLDVFLEPVQIITADQENAKKVAKLYSHPKTNGFQPNIYVSYPICLATELDSLPADKNLILIDANDSAPLLAQCRALCPIQMTEKGYSYLGKQYTGNYCVMQVFPHPQDPEKTILYLNTNRPELYQKNLFTRSVTIPSYINGTHPFWNNEALIFHGKGYYGIYEWGGSTENVAIRKV